MNKEGVMGAERALPWVKSIFGSWKIILVISVGLLFILISLFGSGGSEADGDTEEERIEYMCSSLVGVGECRVMVTYSSEGSRYTSLAQARVESVAIVCRGADKASVRAELTAMISALYGIGANRIFISKMK